MVLFFCLSLSHSVTSLWAFSFSCVSQHTHCKRLHWPPCVIHLLWFSFYSRMYKAVSTSSAIVSQMTSIITTQTRTFPPPHTLFQPHYHYLSVISVSQTTVTDQMSKAVRGCHGFALAYWITGVDLLTLCAVAIWTLCVGVCGRARTFWAMPWLCVCHMVSIRSTCWAAEPQS